MNIKSQMLKTLAIIALFTTSWGLYKQYLLSDNNSYSFKISTSTRTSLEHQSAIFESFIIPQEANIPAAHSSSFTNLPNGDIIAFWFAGTKEGNPDVRIWSAKFHEHKWSNPVPIVDSKMVSTSNHRYVVKIGNPVVYRADNGTLHLFVVSVSVGGWSGSTLNHLKSYDEGKTWSNPERIVNSPFFNISTLVRTS
ncbi:MAG: exo-alpha-sialidase, partial [Burkholderiales bacterium]|nr:exo-alpha-sialidase [Burkholderiales bacterium]